MHTMLIFIYGGVGGGIYIFAGFLCVFACVCVCVCVCAIGSLCGAFFPFLLLSLLLLIFPALW